MSGTKGGLGYLGLSYAQENEDKVKTLQVDGGDGCVEPTTETVQDASYKPLSRPAVHLPVAEGARSSRWSTGSSSTTSTTADTIAEQAQFVPMTDGAGGRREAEGGPDRRKPQ